MKNNCHFCGEKKWFWKRSCSDCGLLFKTLTQNVGVLGLGQLMDALIATGIDKHKIRKFLETDVKGNGSILDQILAGLTNNLAEGIGVKGRGMTPNDVREIREKPRCGVSNRPID